jgi:hypothetical protein
VALGEASKCFATRSASGDALLAAKIERGDVVIALGGGVVGDLRICRRGGPPRHRAGPHRAGPGRSSLGATAIDPTARNQIGAYQPILVEAYQSPRFSSFVPVSRNTNFGDAGFSDG